MADKKPEEPLGFTAHTRSLAGEYAHEQGWGLNEDERTRLDTEQPPKGGTTTMAPATSATQPPTPAPPSPPWKP